MTEDRPTADAPSVVIKMDVSLDGFVATPDGGVGWFTPSFDDEVGAYIVETLEGASVHLMGRVLYEDMAAYWPAEGRDEIYGPPMNDKPKAVVSRTLAEPGWGPTRVFAGDLGETVATLRAEPGGYVLVHGGSSLAGEMIRRGLIDELRLNVHPVALGEGLPLFAAATERLELISSRTFANGAVALRYRI